MGLVAQLYKALAGVGCMQEDAEYASVASINCTQLIRGRRITGNGEQQAHLTINCLPLQIDLEHDRTAIP